LKNPLYTKLLETACFMNGLEILFWCSLYTEASTKQTIKDKKEKVYFSGTYIEDRDAPIPGVPCLTGLLVMANSPR